MLEVTVKVIWYALAFASFTYIVLIARYDEWYDD